MTPKEEAEELIQLFVPYVRTFNSEGKYELRENAKQCAIICVQEIKNAYYDANVEYEDGKFETFWSEVIIEINKL